MQNTGLTKTQQSFDGPIKNITPDRVAFCAHAIFVLTTLVFVVSGVSFWQNMQEPLWILLPVVATLAAGPRGLVEIWPHTNPRHTALQRALTALLHPSVNMHRTLRMLAALPLFGLGILAAQTSVWDGVIVFVMLVALSLLRLLLWVLQDPYEPMGPFYGGGKPQFSVQNWMGNGLSFSPLAKPFHIWADSLFPDVPVFVLRQALQDTMKKHDANICLLRWNCGTLWGLGEEVTVLLAKDHPETERTQKQPLSQLLPALRHQKTLNAFLHMDKDKRFHFTPRIWHTYAIRLGVNVASPLDRRASGFELMIRSENNDMTAHDRMMAKHILKTHKTETPKT